MGGSKVSPEKEVANTQGICSIRTRIATVSLFLLAMATLLLYGEMEEWEIDEEIDAWYFVSMCPMGTEDLYVSQDVVSTNATCRSDGHVGAMSQLFSVDSDLFEDSFVDPSYYIVYFFSSDDTYVDYTIWDSEGNALVSQTRHFASEDQVLVCEEGDWYTQNYTSPCPIDWNEVEDSSSDVIECEGPVSYTGPCDHTITLTTGSAAEKEWAESECYVSWPTDCTTVTAAAAAAPLPAAGGGRRRLMGGGGGAVKHGGSTYKARADASSVAEDTWVWMFVPGGEYYRYHRNAEYPFECGASKCEGQLQHSLLRVPDRSFTFKTSGVSFPLTVEIHSAYGVSASDVFFTFGTDDDYDDLQPIRITLIFLALLLAAAAAWLFRYWAPGPRRVKNKYEKRIVVAPASKPPLDEAEHTPTPV